MSATVTNIYEFRGMNADDMKVSYKRLVRKLHPDVRKDVDTATATRDMQILNGEFAHWYAIAARDFVYTTKVNDNPDKKDYYTRTYQNDTYIHDLASAINALLNSKIYTNDLYDVEIVGVFVWIFGVGKEDKMAHKELRDMGFQFKMKWDETRKESIPAWFYTPNYRRINTNTTRQYMERKYGAQMVYGNNGLTGGD